MGVVAELSPETRAISYWMGMKRITQEELSKKMGISKVTLSRSLQGKRDWYGAEVERAVEALGVNRKAFVQSVQWAVDNVGMPIYFPDIPRGGEP